MNIATRQLRLCRLIGQEEISRSQRELEARGQHANHGVTLAIDREPAADDAWIGAEPTLPQAVSQYCYLWTILIVFAVLERSSQQRLDAEHREERGIHARRVQTFRIALAAENRAAASVSSEAFKDAVLLVILVVGIGKLTLRELLLRRLLPKMVETIGRLVRQPAQERSINDREDRRAATDAERERNDGNRRKPRMLQQPPNRKTYVFDY